MQTILYHLYTIEAILSALTVLICCLIRTSYKMRKEQRLRNEEREEKLANISSGLMYMLRVQLIDYHERWTNRGHVTTWGLTNWAGMYETYRALGGNGMIDHLNTEVNQLPTRDKRQNREEI